MSEYTDTDEELAMARAYIVELEAARDVWKSRAVDESAKVRAALAERDRLREALKQCEEEASQAVGMCYGKLVHVLRRARAALATTPAEHVERHKPPSGMDEAIAWKCQRCGEWISEPPAADDYCRPAAHVEPTVCCLGLSDAECAATPVRHCSGLRAAEHVEPT